MNYCAIGLALKDSPKTTWKWAMDWVKRSLVSAILVYCDLKVIAINQKLTYKRELGVIFWLNDLYTCT